VGNTATRWAWVMGNETYDDLLATGWVANATGYFSAAYAAAPYVRTYLGALGVRRALAMVSASGLLYWPAHAINAANDSGISGDVTLAWSVMHAGAGTPNAAMTSVLGAITGQTSKVQWNNTLTSVDVYVSSTYKATSSALDVTAHNWFVFHLSIGGTTHLASLEANGVEIVAEQSQGGKTAQSVAYIYSQASGVGALPNSAFWTEFAAYDNYAAVVPVLYVDRYEGTVDGTDNGAWTPSAGPDNFAVLDSPADGGTTYTSGGVASGEYVETSGGTIADQLGISPAIDAVVAIMCGSGMNVFMDTRISNNGAAFADNGADIALDFGQKTAVNPAPVRPSDSADWVAGDTITIRNRVA